MKDVLDVIIDRLPPSLLESILESGSDSLPNSSSIDGIIVETQTIRMRQALGELKRKSLDLHSKTIENSKLLQKILNDLKLSKSVDKSSEIQQNIDAMKKKINVLKDVRIWIFNRQKAHGAIKIKNCFISL